MSPRKILIVEDEPDIQEILTRFLECRGHEVKQAITSAQGLQLLNTDHPHLLLIDKRLPDCLGYELIRSAKDQHGDMPTRTILMTGDYTGDVDELDTPDVVLQKPFGLRDLATVVESLLAR